MQYTCLWLPVHDPTLSSGFGAIELGEDLGRRVRGEMARLRFRQVAARKRNAERVWHILRCAPSHRPLFSLALRSIGCARLRWTTLPINSDTLFESHAADANLEQGSSGQRSLREPWFCALR
jgi:hypothetical protein